MRRLDFIGNLDEEPPFDYLREKAPFWEEVGGLFFVYVQNYYMLEVGWSFLLWSKLYLEGWSSRSIYFLSVACKVPEHHRGRFS